MIVAAPGRAMAKRNDVGVKIDAEVASKAKIAASYRGVSLAEYLSMVVLPVALRDIDEGHELLKNETRPKRTPKG